MGEKVGYARVSSAGQSLDVQIEKLRNAGCEVLFTEKATGTKLERTELLNCLQYVRMNDTVYISRLDRLARSLSDLLTICSQLKERGVELVVLDQGLDTSTSEGKLMLQVLGAFSEFEVSIRAERQLDGIRKAQAMGRKFGRRPALSEEQKEKIFRLRTEENFSMGQLSERFAVSPSTVQRALREVCSARA